MNNQFLAALVRIGSRAGNIPGKSPEYSDFGKALCLSCGVDPDAEVSLLMPQDIADEVRAFEAAVGHIRRERSDELFQLEGHIEALEAEIEGLREEGE